MKIKFHKVIALWAFMIPAASLEAQTNTLTIETCYKLARENYPLIKKKDLITRTGRYSLENAAKLYLPQVSVYGQASYQSQTIDFADVLPGPLGNSLPVLSKDQYKIQADISEQIYDGGNTRYQKALIRTDEQINQESIEVSLNTLKDRVNQVYFSILLLAEQLKQNEIRKADLQSALDKASAAYQNGTGLRSNADELKAELLNAAMTDIEFRSGQKAYLDMLSQLIGQPVDTTTDLIQPEAPAIVSDINRPELMLYDLKKKSFDTREKQLKSDYLPRLSAFVEGAYGRPTLNFIENQFGAWWIGGLRLNWNLGSLYTLKNNRSMLNISRQDQDIDKETFLFNTRLTLSQQNGDIRKYSELMQKDDNIISLRVSVAESAKAQLENGVITVHEYISKLSEENQAVQSRILHHIQLLLARYNYKTTSGN